MIIYLIIEYELLLKKMLKNLKPEELQNHSENSENIEDSKSIDENEQEPLCSFDISLNNGKKATLEINEGDNYEQKVKNFCLNYKISPQDGKVLLQRVKEEIEMYSNNENENDVKNNNNINYVNKSNEIPSDNIPKKENLILGDKDYKANDQKRLDHILNESESMSLSESASQSQKKFKNMKQNINNNIKPIPKDNMNINKTVINNNMNNNMNKDYIPQNSAFIPIPNTLINFSNNVVNPNTQKFYRVNNDKNKIKKKQTFTKPLTNNISPIIYNNNTLQTPNINKTFNNNVVTPNSPINDYKNIFSDYSFNPKRTKTTYRNNLLDQNIGFIENNNLLNNNKNNIKVMTPKTTYKYNNIISSPNNYTPKSINKPRESLICGYPITNEFNFEQSPIINKKESLIYNYDNPIEINNFNNNDYPINNQINLPKTAKVIESYRIIDNNYNNQNSFNDPKSVNINYENLDNNIYETIVNPAIEYNEYTKNNINNITSPNYNTTNFETNNNPIIEYNNNYESINNSPIIKYNKNDSINNQLVEYHYDTQSLENNNNNQNINNTQSDFPIYENIQIIKDDQNQNNNKLIIINNNNDQNLDYINPKKEEEGLMTYGEIIPINNNINQFEKINNIDETLTKNCNDLNFEKKRNTIFISNVRKITDEEIAQNEYNKEEDDKILENNNNNGINKEEDKNEENNFNKDDSIKNNILNNNINNTINKVNEINIASTTTHKTDLNGNNNLTITQTQNIDYKPEKKNEDSKDNKNDIIKEKSDNNSNDIYIKKNIDSFNDSQNKYNSPKNKIISKTITNTKQNIIRKPINLEKPKDNKSKTIIENGNIKPAIKKNDFQINKKNENEIENNTIKDNNSKLLINSPLLNKNPINKINKDIINNTNKNNSIINSNIFEENNNPENKKNSEKSEESSNQENLNENFSESNIIIEEENSDKEPQDNIKKKSPKIIVPKDTDESNYKENQIQYDNLSLDSKNNDINNRSDKKPPRKSYLTNSNNDKQIEHNNIINKEDEMTNSNGSINYQNKNNKKDANNYNNNINNKSNNIKSDSSYNNISDNINVSSIKNEKFINYIDKDLSQNRPKYKRNINQETIDSFPSPSVNSKNKTKSKVNNIYQKKEINNNKKIIHQQKPIMKVLTIRKENLNKNNNIIDKRSNSSGARSNRSNRSIKSNRYNSNNKIKNPGERLYDNYMKKLPKKMEQKQKLLKERLEEENKELLLRPQIDKNSRRIIERIRSSDDERDRVEERLINYGNNKRQKHLIQYANKDLQNQVNSPFRPQINKISRELAERNKQNRINETKNILENKKLKNKFKKIDLEKEFGKRNRSIGNEHKNVNSFINFDEPKNVYNKTKFSVKRHSNINSDSNYSNNINSNSNSKRDKNNVNEENNLSSSPLNKTFDLNNAYRELYNSIDEKIDSDLTKFFNTNVDLNLNTTENNNNVNNQSKKNPNSKQIKCKNIFKERSLTPNSYLKNYQNYNAFDYLYYESKNIGKKNKKKQEMNFKRNHPFKPRISPLAKKLKNKKESTNEFFDRISKNLEEIKIVNSKPKKSKIINEERDDKKNNYSFRPRISRGPKNINQRDVTVNLEGFYDKRIIKNKDDLLNSKKEEENEKKILYNQKSKDIIIKMKIKKYKELFSLLDSDQDGFISSTKIQLTKVDENVLKNIAPILEELNQTNKEMNFKEFCIKLDKIMTEEKENNNENQK